MRMREAFTIDALNAMADAIMRLPGVLAFFVVASGGVALTALYVLSVSLADGLLLLGTVILLWLCILALGVELKSAERKLVDARGVLLQVAFHKCRCDPNATIKASDPEIDGKPLGKGYCDACQARTLLREQFPGAIQFRVRELVLQGLSVSDDLMSCLTPGEQALLQSELDMGWKVPFYPEAFGKEPHHR